MSRRATKSPKSSAKKELTKEAATLPKVLPQEPARAAGPQAGAQTGPQASPRASSQEPARALPYADLPPVLIAAAECAPLAKAGGLADVVGALPKYLALLGIDARVIMPYHQVIKRAHAGEVEHLCHFDVHLGWRTQYVGLERLVMDGVTYYLIDNEFYFGGPLYCGGEFEGEQYAFFTRAVLESLPRLEELCGFRPGILHCNDWHTSLIPVLARSQYQGRPPAAMRSLLTIHNLAYQGRFSHDFLADVLGIDDPGVSPEAISHFGCDDMLKAGIVYSDCVNTVSPTYAQEICGPDFGETLDGTLRGRASQGRLLGILNGIDTDVWNPSADPALPACYGAGPATTIGKLACKQALLQELGLMGASPDVPLIAMVGRLTPQKGVDLVLERLDEIMSRDIRMVILGSGDANLEDALRAAEDRHRGRLCAYIGYNGALSHRIYAAADLFLMPSAFEPCGISQMIAMRYGTLPIVRETGGLRDTVTPYNRFTGEGTGFSFAHYDSAELMACVDSALDAWHDGEVRAGLISQAMACDFGFERCARSYADAYRLFVSS